MKTVIFNHPEKPDFAFDSFLARKGGEVQLRNGTSCKIVDFLTIEKNGRGYPMVSVQFEDGQSPFSPEESISENTFLFNNNGIYSKSSIDDESLDLILKQPLNYSTDLDIQELFEQIERIPRFPSQK